MPQEMTLADLVRRLETMGVEEPSAEAELLLCHLFGLTPAFLAASKGRVFSSDALDSALSRREKREPLAYILGVQWFWRQEYLVTPDCLIPRPDTEILVEEALKVLPLGGRFLDLCTGSGCIALSLLCERPDLTAVAVDLYPATLDVARKNAERLCVTERIGFVRDDVLSPGLLSDYTDHVRASNASSTPKSKFDVIVSNPPYVPAAVIPTLSPEVRQEPHAALDGGGDGLVFYRAILTKQADLLVPGGVILFEIGYDQGQALIDLAASHGFTCSIVKDLGGRDRVAVLRPVAYTDTDTALPASDMP